MELRGNPAFCPYCHYQAAVVPISTELNLSICTRCKRLWQDGRRVKLVPFEYNPSRRKNENQNNGRL